MRPGGGADSLVKNSKRRTSVRQLYGLASDETTFLLEAAEHYCATRCPLATGEGSCPMLTWREGVHTGAIERVCKGSPAAWRERFAPGRGIRPLPLHGEVGA
jgi:hypothetical protein